MERSRSRSGFTLIELLLVSGIVGILSVAGIFILNPAELLRQARDATRLSDLSALHQAISVLKTDVNNAFLGTSSIVYISIPSTTSTCAGLGLPGLPVGWQYNCVPQNTLKNVDGSGWIPINFTQSSFGSPIARLPADPSNATTSGFYYTFVPSSNAWELTAVLESQKQSGKMASDGGISTSSLEVGTNLTLTPTSTLARALPQATSTTSASIAVTDDTNSNTGFNLTGAVFSSTSVAGVGASASLTLLMTSSTFGGNWQAFGTYGAGVNQFYRPSGVAVDPANNKLYVIDTYNHRVIRTDSGTGGTTLGANWQSFGTTGAGVGQFSYPFGIALDLVNNKLYVADTYNHRIARMDSGAGGTTLGANWENFGVYGAAANQFSYPHGIFDDATHNKVYVMDTSNSRVVSIDAGSGGTTLGANWQSFGVYGGGVNAFGTPETLAGDTGNNKLFVADTVNSRLVQIDSGTGGTTLGANWQSFGTAGAGVGQFSYPAGVAVDSANHKVYVSEMYNYRVSRMDSGIGGTTLGANWQSFGTTGAGVGQFADPHEVVLDAAHTMLFVADYTNNRVATFGSGGAGYSTPGTYVSGPIDTGVTTASWGTISWVNSGGGSTSVVMKARSSATTDFSMATAWGSCGSVANGSALSTGGCVTAGNRYIQFQATLATTDPSVSPSLDSVTVGYTY